MEVIPEGSNFRLVPEEELPQILEVLAKYLPDSLKFHQTIHTYLKDKVWDFHFYVAKNWPEEPIILHFPGMTATPNGKTYESLCVFCPTDRLELLEHLAGETVLIEWSQPLYMNFTHGRIMTRIEEFYTARGGRLEEKVHGDIYVLDGQPPEEDIKLDELQDCEVLELKEEHAKAIHDLYPANDMESIEVFEKLIRALPAYGVFSGGELAAWMVQSYYGAMFSMQTRPEFRRKGYGIHLAHRLTNAVRQRGYFPFVVIRPENDASLSLYHKLGFKRAYPTLRAVLRPPPHLANSSSTLEEEEAQNGEESKKLQNCDDIESGFTGKDNPTGDTKDQ